MSELVMDRADDPEVTLRDVILSLWSGRWWIVGSFVVFTALFVTAALVMTPRYRATTVVVPATGEQGGGGGQLSSALSQLGGLASLAGVNLGSSASDAEESMAVLRSREFTEAFIRDAQLMPQLYPTRWDVKTGRWIGPEEDWPTLAQAYAYFDKGIRTVTLDKKTGLISIQVEWRDRIKAAQWANTLVERLNSEMRARAIARTNASVGYLDKELAATTTLDTRQAINRLLEAQINRRMYANVTNEYALRVVDRALPPDQRDIAKPNKLLLFLLGPAAGLVFGAAAVLVVNALRRSLRGAPADIVRAQRST